MQFILLLLFVCLLAFYVNFKSHLQAFKAKMFLFAKCAAILPVWQQALRHNAIKSLYND